MRNEATSADTSQFNTKLLDWIEQIKILMASDKYKTVKEKLHEITGKYPDFDAPGNNPNANFSSGSNALFSSAIHGVFVGFWAEFDLFLEVLFLKMTKIDEISTSVICSTLQSGVKLQILKM